MIKPAYSISHHRHINQETLSYHAKNVVNLKVKMRSFKGVFIKKIPYEIFSKELLAGWAFDTGHGKLWLRTLFNRSTTGLHKSNFRSTISYLCRLMISWRADEVRKAISSLLKGFVVD